MDKFSQCCHDIEKDVLISSKKWWNACHCHWNIPLWIRGVSSGGLRGLEHPPKFWHNSQLSSCVTTIVTDKQQLIAKTNNKLTGLALNDSFSLLQGLKQPSLSSSCLRERVNEGRGQRFGGVAKNFARALCARLAQHLPSSNPGHAPVDDNLWAIFITKWMKFDCQW